MSNLPAIILVHGFWGGAAHWSKVILELKRLGHDNLHAVELPLTSLADDAERTRKMIAQQQGPVLLVLLSLAMVAFLSQFPFLLSSGAENLSMSILPLLIPLMVGLVVCEAVRAVVPKKR